MNYDENGQEIEGDVTSTYRLNSWMADLYSSIKSLRIGQLSLASAHNAGMDYEAPYSNSYIACQDKSFRNQLDNGVRVLDIRLRWFSGYGDDNVNSGLIFYHSQTSGRTFANMLHDIDRFQETNPGEIVILDFHELSQQRSDKPIPYAAIHAHFMGHYTGKMLPRSASTLTLEQIRAQYPGPRIIVAVPNEVCAGGRDNTYFWNKINHEWAGDGIVELDRLLAHIESVMANPPSGTAPWSLSATVYNIGGPRAIISDLVQWFPKFGDRIKKCNIINFDFCSRNSALAVQQCIESNILKGSRLAITSPVPGGWYLNGASSVKGGGMPGATIELYDRGAGSYDGGVVNAQGVWEARVDLHPVWNHPLACRQTINGATSDWSEFVTFNVLASVPTPIISTPTNGSTVDARKPLISGYNGVPGATVRFYEEGSGAILYGTAIVEPDGTWESRPDVALPAGRFRLTCDQFDSGWTSGYATESAFTVPDFPNSVIELWVEKYGTRTDIQWRTDPEDIGKVSFVCYLNDGNEKATSGNSASYDYLSENSTYRATVFAINAAGLRSEPAEITFRI
ncbi:hypothetical protein [Pseudomonas mohnii]